MRRAALAALAPAAALACESAHHCRAPFGNKFLTSTTAGGAKPSGCCKTMPRVPLIDARHKPVAPPGMDAAGAVCPDLPKNLVIGQGKGPLNDSLYPQPQIFFVGEDGGDEGRNLPEWGVAPCETPHPFYTQYVSAYANDTTYAHSIPVLGSADAPPASLVTSADTIAEMLRQMDGKIPGLRDVMVRAGSRYAVWADVERRTDTCEYCKKHDPTWDCGPHIDSRAGRDASYHPEAEYCQEGADGTMLVEEYGIPYLEANGSVRESYCGTNIVAHEYFHEIHETAIKTVDYQGYLAIEQATQRAVREGLYVHHPGAKDDGCNPDFTQCVAYEFIVKIHMLWNGFPSAKAELPWQTRAEMKAKAPWAAALVYRFFEDGDWNPALGARIDAPRDQTFGLTCATSHGSALCGEPLSQEYIGEPMEQVLARCGEECSLPPVPGVAGGGWAPPAPLPPYRFHCNAQSHLCEAQTVAGHSTLAACIAACGQPA